MTITTQHPASVRGFPVILDDDGGVVPLDIGVQSLRRALTLTTQQLADLCGVSRRSVEGWEQGRSVPCESLNVMADLLRK